MSDLRAAAEARRKKILARDQDRLLAAKGEKKFEALSPDSVDESEVSLKKERPLAARRNKIAAVSSVEKKEEPTSDVAGDPPDVSPAQVDSGSANKPKIQVPKKTIDEINAEIQANTKKFDEDVLSKPKQEVVKQEEKKEEKKTQVMLTSTMMSIVRLLLFIVIGACIGYRSAVSESSRIEKVNLLTNPSNIIRGVGGDTDGMEDINVAQKALLDKISGSSGISSGSMDAMPAGGIGLVPWVVSYGEGMFEYGILGAILVWSISWMLKTPLEKSLGTKSPNSSGIIALLLSIYNHGFTGIFEIILTSIAEVVLYMLVIISSGATFSYLFVGKDISSPLSPQVVNEL